MWSQEEIKTAVPLAVAVVAGLFTIGAAVLTWKLTGRRERLKLQQEHQLQHYKSMEDLYASLLEMLQAGNAFRYFMVYERRVVDGAYKLDDFLNTLREI